MFIILIHHIPESIEYFGSFQGRAFGPTGGGEGASRQPSDVPCRKFWIRHCDFPMYPYVWCLYSIPKVKPTILWWWWWRGSTSFATFSLYTSSLSLHWILYIPGEFWQWTPPLTNIGPLPPLWKPKVDYSSPLKAKLNGIDSPFEKYLDPPLFITET
jgi:hypothetical protein